MRARFLNLCIKLKVVIQQHDFYVNIVKLNYFLSMTLDLKELKLFANKLFLPPIT